jgi:hypothetical protein
MPKPQFHYVDQPAISWTVPIAGTGKLHLYGAADGKPCQAAFSFSDDRLNQQLAAHGVSLPDDLASDDGVELTFIADIDDIFLTVSNALPNSKAVTVRLECWDPQPNLDAHQFTVPGEQVKAEVRRVVYV